MIYANQIDVICIYLQKIIFLLHAILFLEYLMYTIYFKTHIDINVIHNDSIALVLLLQAGHVCGDTRDIVDGAPTGSVRASFGYCSTYADVDTLLSMVSDAFVHKRLKIDLQWLQTQLNTEDILKINEEPSGNGNEKQNGRKENHSNNIIDSKIEDSLRNIPIENLVLSKNNVQRDHPLLDTTTKLHNSKTETTVNLVSDLVLTDIRLYPIKSCGALSVQRWTFGERGLLYDRHWMVVSRAGYIVTQKRQPLMCLIAPSIDTERGLLTLSYPSEHAIYY